MIENGHYGSAPILLPSLGRHSSDLSIWHAGGIVPCLGCQVITRNAIRDCKICRVISGLSRSHVVIEELTGCQRFSRV